MADAEQGGDGTQGQAVAVAQDDGEELGGQGDAGAAAGAGGVLARATITGTGRISPGRSGHPMMTSQSSCRWTFRCCAAKVLGGVINEYHRAA